MHHNLDIHPIPEGVLYINEMDFLEPNYYELKEQIKKAASGKTIAQGGILPDDNVRIYVPMDLNADKIMWRLYRIYMALDDPDYHNETEFSTAVGIIVAQLEIYDQVWVARDAAHAVQKSEGGVYHSQKGIELAKKIIEYLEENEGCAECFPYEIIDKLKDEFIF